MINIKYIFYFYIFKQIFAAVKNDCEVSSYCEKEIYGCSVYGNCNYKLYDYYKEGATEEDKLPHCDCYKGYSSYDILVQKKDNNVLCCYKKKGMLTAFFLELFISFGVGHFYLGNYIFACVKLCVELFLCVTIGCTTYFACTREHSFETNCNEINNNENVNKNIVNENKNNIIKNENNDMIDENDNENDNDNDTNENKNNDQSFELEENKESEIMFQNFINCPKSMIVIWLSIISIFLYHLVDICLIAFGFFKDGNGEELYMWI